MTAADRLAMTLRTTPMLDLSDLRTDQWNWRSRPFADLRTLHSAALQRSESGPWMLTCSNSLD
jgi:hypothetical protein